MEPLPPIVSAAWLAEHVDDVVVADVRWYLDGRSGVEAYRTGHVPGAVWVDLDGVLSDPPTASAGRHPLPGPDRFAAGLGSLGIGDGTVVVAYDDQRGMSAGRLVWMLRALGEEAALLDGGLDAWVAADQPIRGGDESRPPTTFSARPWPAGALATADQTGHEAALSGGSSADTGRPARNGGGGAVVLDARAPERFRGEVEPIDARPGHVPGARNAPFAANLDPASGQFRPPAELRERYEALGVRFPGEAGTSPGMSAEVIVYCGSGVSACHDLLALELAGLPRGQARLYPGSWSQWAADAAREAAVGDET